PKHRQLADATALAGCLIISSRGAASRRDHHCSPSQATTATIGLMYQGDDAKDEFKRQRATVIWALDLLPKKQTHLNSPYQFVRISPGRNGDAASQGL